MIARPMARVRPVLSDGTERTHPSVIQEEPAIGGPSLPTKKETQKSAEGGLENGESKQPETSIPTSSPSEEPIRSSKKRYRKPGDAKQLAAQASYIATQVLNGEIDLDTARIYATLARTAAQGLSIEMQLGRLNHKKPDLDLAQDWEE